LSPSSLGTRSAANGRSKASTSGCGPGPAPRCALFERDGLPSRSALSHWLAVLTVEPVEALRACFLSDLLARPLGNEEQPSGLWDRADTQWFCFDVDGMREAARKPRFAEDAGPACRRAPLAPAVCAGLPGAQAGGGGADQHHGVAGPYPESRLGTFGNEGLGEQRVELRRAVAAIQAYVRCYGPQSSGPIQTKKGATSSCFRWLRHSWALLGWRDQQNGEPAASILAVVPLQTSNRNSSASAALLI
jgi:hypothetical protein